MKPRHIHSLPLSERWRNECPTGARSGIAIADAAHYSQRDLVRALHLYQEVIASHASARQAGYSRSQIRNIVKVVVPEQEFPDARVALALVCLERLIAPDAELIPLASPAPGPAE